MVKFRKRKIQSIFLTKECDYAIRIIRALADMELKPGDMICAREHIPRSFTYKILKKLERAGIVGSRRGAAGGYILLKSPDALTLLDIASAVDDNLYVNACMQPGFVCPHNSDGSINVHKELDRVQGLLVKTLSEKNISDII